MLHDDRHIVKHNVADAQYLVFDMGIPAESTPGMESQIALQLTYPGVYVQERKWYAHHFWRCHIRNGIHWIFDSRT